MRMTRMRRRLPKLGGDSVRYVCYIPSIQRLDRWLTRAQAQELAQDLIARAKESSQEAEPENNGDTHVIPPDLRKAKTAQVMKLLDRECVNLFLSLYFTCANRLAN